ncbi:MAG: site-2 protease family protein [Clostridia bacterium]|nr:site-2 protease family protein [Clostridia bacterium]
MAEIILNYICIFLALMVVLPFHEFAHAYAAVKNGDITPKLYGRYTLNPFAHFDIYGLMCFVFAGFGWAKPVPVNPYNYRNFKKGCFWVSISGVLMNLIIAFVALPLFILSKNLPTFGYFTFVLQNSLYYVYSLSVVFFVFNLLPLYPLDGFRVVEVITNGRGSIYYFLRRYGTYILLGLFGLSILSDITGIVYIDILGYVLRVLTDYVCYPLERFWLLIFYGV